MLRWYWLAVCIAGFAIPASATNQSSVQASHWQQSWWLASQHPQQQQLNWLAGDVSALPKQVPLGSLWKLFVYIYSVDNGLPETPYACHAGKAAMSGDEYCCSQDEIITRDVALARSCGLYFETKRLQIDAAQWQQYWQKQVPEVKWLQQMDKMQPQSQTSVQDILTALSKVSVASVSQARQALLGRILQPQWSPVMPYLGGAYRFKTFTWHHPQYAGAYFGGGAGWLPDGTVFWLGGAGGSREVWLRSAQTLAKRLPIQQHYSQQFDEACVVVDYFTRYPIDRLQMVEQPKKAVVAGVLRGQYVVKFSNGNALNISSNGELTLARKANQWHIFGKLGLQEYIARVVDREADATQIEAAKALSIAARSYLYQNGYFHQACWHIDDDSRAQRVSANAASKAAKIVATMTDDLALTGSPIYYHQNKSAPNTLNWQAATQQAALGQDYLAILHEAYPNASWRTAAQTQVCKRLPMAEAYLQKNSRTAQQALSNIAGFEPVMALKVCQLDYGNPYSDQQTLSMYVRDWRSENDRMTLWHEYLHLALRYHPNGANEPLIEATAQQLARNLLKTSAQQIRNAQ